MLRSCTILALSVFPLCAQSVISAHSGVVQFTEGTVCIDGHELHPKFAQFPELKPDQVLTTQDGRAEILLTPGVFLRVARNSSTRMVSNSLSDTRLELISGSALIEVGELLKHNTITIESHGAQIALPKRGLYRIDSEPLRLRVYDGQAQVSSGSAQLTVKKKQELDLESDTLQATKFDTEANDAFYSWNAQRAESVAAANVTSARVTHESAKSSGWAWNPYFGMFTFIPASGIYWSPFGPTFYNPAMVPYMTGPGFSTGVSIHPRIGAGARGAAGHR